MFANRLYKTWDGDIYYWQIFSHPDNPFHLIVSEGLLGGSGRVSEASCENGEQARAAYDELVRGKKSEGFQEVAHLEMITLQFDASDARGAEAEEAFKDEMIDYLGNEMYWSGNGGFIGGNVGQGQAYINLSFEVVSPAAAVNTIVQALADKKVDRSFFIVHEVPEEGGGVAANVIYPEEVKLTLHSKAR